jgi:hypothetical protein
METGMGHDLPRLNVDFDTQAKTGWAFFTKFLFVNVAAMVAVLLLIAAFTVWR